MENIRGRDSSEFRTYKEKFGGWVVRDIVPYGMYAGSLTWMINYEHLTEVDPNEFNSYLSMHCEDPTMMVFGLNQYNRWKFAEFLEALSYTRNTVIFRGDTRHDGIFNMADSRILFIPSGVRIEREWFEVMITERDQWIFEIGNVPDLTKCVNTTFRHGKVPFVFAMPKWQPPTDDPLVISRYLYRYLSHAFRISQGIINANLPQVRVCLDLSKVLKYGNKGDPEYLRTKVREKISTTDPMST